MIIGIDFDNTIIKYNSLFKKVAITAGFINKNWNGNGITVLHKHLHNKPER